MTNDPDVIRIPKTACLQCRHTLDSIGTNDGSRPAPQPGDAIVCIRCGAVQTIENGKLRPFTDSELDTLQSDPEWLRELARMVAKVYILRQVN